jgi:hypothetical protein
MRCDPQEGAADKAMAGAKLGAGTSIIVGQVSLKGLVPQRELARWELNSTL